jgi:mannose-6-phosphate isomerase-like protein (cupin superfamily)
MIPPRKSGARLPLTIPADKISAMKTLMFLVALPLMAADPAGFSAWTQSDIQTHAKGVKLDEHKAGVDRAGNWGNHGFLIVRREGDGEAEIHETQVDVITVVSGEGTLVVGGSAVETHPTTAGEIRGKSITGGTNHKMSAGDVFHIPAKVPHQMLVPKSLVIQVVKVDVK